MNGEPLFHAEALLAVPLTLPLKPCSRSWKNWRMT